MAWTDKARAAAAAKRRVKSAAPGSIKSSTKLLLKRSQTTRTWPAAERKQQANILRVSKSAVGSAAQRLHIIKAQRQSDLEAAKTRAWVKKKGWK